MNDRAKRQLEQYEKAAIQNSIRSRKLEEDIGYYKSKFEDLELRLNSLISTHNNQNSYLKKSPIILVFEKLLKFVHGVQGRTSQAPIDHSITAPNTLRLQ